MQCPTQRVDLGTRVPLRLSGNPKEKMIGSPGERGQEKIQLYHINTNPEDVVVANPETDPIASAQEEIKQKRPDCYSIIHDKIIVIDPLTDNPIVITGSHNLGYHASYNKNRIRIVNL